MFRNPVAHDPRLRRTVSDDELLELLTTLSMIHRRLDTATTTSDTAPAATQRPRSADGTWRRDPEQS
jgi:hypothetical protein